MSGVTISLIVSLVANLILALLLFFKSALNELVKETFLRKVRKRDEHSKLLGKLQRYAYQFTYSSVLRLKYLRMKAGEVTSNDLDIVQAEHKEARNFLLENIYQFSPGLQGNIQKLMMASGLQKEELIMTAHALLVNAIETEQAKS